MNLPYLLVPSELSDEAAAHIAELLHHLAIAFDNQYFAQIQRHYQRTLPTTRTTAPRRIPTQRRTARALRTPQLAVLNRLPHPPDHRHQRNAGAGAPRNPRFPCSSTKPEQCDQSSLARSEIIRKVPHGFT